MTAPLLPPLPNAPLTAPLRVVVLTGSDLGFETARALSRVANVDVVAVVHASPPSSLSIAKRLRLTYRRRGVRGLIALPLRKLRTALGGRVVAGFAPIAPPEDIPVVRLDRFETPDGLAALRALSPDLAVVDGTYILKEAVFALPRFGSVNLHCGRLPDYKGAPPAFWELYNDEPDVGVTVHRVTARLDAGPVLASATVPLDRAPEGDPMHYVQRLWREALRREGIRLLGDVVSAMAAGAVQERPQGTTTHPTYKFPDWSVVRELRARVRTRRAAGARA